MLTAMGHKISVTQGALVKRLFLFTSKFSVKKCERSELNKGVDNLWQRVVSLFKCTYLGHNE